MTLIAPQQRVSWELRPERRAFVLVKSDRKGGTHGTRTKDPHTNRLIIMKEALPGLDPRHSIFRIKGFVGIAYFFGAQPDTIRGGLFFEGTQTPIRIVVGDARRMVQAIIEVFQSGDHPILRINTDHYARFVVDFGKFARHVHDHFEIAIDLMPVL